MLMVKEKYKIIETIYSSRNSTIFKAVNTENDEKVILKTINQDFYNVTPISKIRNEYNLLKKLEGEYVVKGYELFKEEIEFSIVMEDFGGISLSKYIKTNSIEMNELLDISLKITKCIWHIHKNNVIHKDINPSNIIYNPISKEIKIIDFGISSEFSFETVQALNPNKLEGTLLYISPEQTGRMNRPLDYRTDFYSLGVTLYELACGTPPFVSFDTGELVHSHIAKHPAFASEINPKIPKMFSRILSKLMEKMAEERYKNAIGIAFDLQRCIDLFKNNEIEEFELGEGDISDWFEIPKKLYGRENEIENLLSHFETISKESAGMIFIGGYSGIGKTSLVNELYKPIIKEQGIFVSGKFDQFRRNTPFSAFFHAIEEFCDYILSETKAEIEDWKKRILEGLDSKGGLITEAVPRLKMIIGEQPILSEVTAIESQLRFKIALENLIKAISSKEHPILFFMDDLHWADMSSLELFESILTNETIKGFVFIGTYRDNEVDVSHPLIRTVEKIKKKNGKIEYVKLENLGMMGIEQIISDTLSVQKKEIKELAKIIHSKTLGNPFYTLEFLKHCNKQNLIYYEHSKKRWEWNETEIYNNKISDNVAEFLVQNINEIPETTRGLISIASSIGSVFNLKILSQVTQKDIKTIGEELKPAISAEIISVLGNRDKSFINMEFHFNHDRFQQMGYLLLDEKTKKSIHLSLARYYEKLQSEEANSYIFIVAEHYFKAFPCISSKEEKERVLEVFVKAAHAASLSSAFDVAKHYLEFALPIAVEDLHKEDSFLFDIYVEYHMVLVSLALLEEADQIYALIEKFSKDPVSLTDSCCLQLQSLSNRVLFEKGFFLGISLLEKLGITYPKDTLTDVIMKEIEKYYEYERKGSIENLDQKEMLYEEEGIAIAKILNRLIGAGFFFNPLAGIWCSMLNVNLMLEKGITSSALMSSTTLSTVLITFKNDFSSPYKLSKKALIIAEKEGFSDELYRMYHAVSLISFHWFDKLEANIEYAHKSYKGNLSNGEFEFACFSYIVSQPAILDCGNSISELETESLTALSFANKMANLHAIATSVNFRQLVKTLKGETYTLGSFNDEDFTEDQYVEEFKNNGTASCHYYVYRSLSAVLFGDFKTSMLLTESSAPIMFHITGFYPVSLHNFLYSLSICKNLGEIENEEKKQSLLKTLKENQEWLYKRAMDAPFNFMHLYLLIEAEIKAYEKKYSEAFLLYEKAMTEAKKNSRLYQYAMICELAGECYLSIGIEKAGITYIREAYFAFLSWEATGKVEALKEKYKYILFQKTDNETILNKTTVTQSTVNSSTVSDSIDLNSVVNAAQAISKEIEIERLLERLMKIIIENSGSDTGHILLLNKDKWILSVSGRVNSEITTLLNGKEMILESEDSKKIFPISMISYVIRTKEPLIIGRVKDSRFASDVYFEKKSVSSALCIPILSQNALKGIVYLENSTLEEVFTKERLEVLTILSSQAAVSLENSVLYSELENRVKERTNDLNQALKKLEEQHNKLKSTQTQLIQSEKMAGLGTMVAGVAHEINNPTNFIYLSSKTLEENIEEFKQEVLDMMAGNDEETIKYFQGNFDRFEHSINHILNGSNRIKTIVQDLRAFSRLDEAEKKEIVLSEAVESTLRIVKTQYDKQIEFVRDYKSAGNIECYPAQLNQVFLNIIVNACQSILKKQEEFENKTMGKVEICLQERVSLDNCEEVCISFKDNGCGMSEEVKNKIFEPFFTTKPIGQGTGLGMSISYGIIENHKGKIDVVSTVGEGTTITVILPQY